MSGRAKRSLYLFLTVILLTLIGILGDPQIALLILFIVVVVGLPLFLAWKFSPVTVNRRPTWNQCITMILTTMLVGNGLAALWPVWLAPPRLVYTAFLYLIPALEWFPMMLILLSIQPTGKSKLGAILLLMIPGTALCLAVGALTGPNLGVLSIGPLACQQETTGPGQSRYDCKHNFSFGNASAYDQLVFEGPA